MEVSLDKVKPGVEVLGEIKDASGRVVVKSGTKLTPLLIKRLVSWGVASLEIAGDEASSAANATSNVPKEEKKESSNIDKELVLRIAKKFSNVREDPLMDKIMRLSIKHLSNRQSKN